MQNYRGLFVIFVLSILTFIHLCTHPSCPLSIISIIRRFVNPSFRLSVISFIRYLFVLIYFSITQLYFDGVFIKKCVVSESFSAVRSNTGKPILKCWSRRVTCCVSGLPPVVILFEGSDVISVAVMSNWITFFVEYLNIGTQANTHTLHTHALMHI